MPLEFKQASRQGVKPLIGIYASSGRGKTNSALLLARGFVGTSGKIGFIDTESGRGSLYADVIPGGYETLELRQPFSPMRYIEAIHAAEARGFGFLILDSCSHSWEGVGGVTDMAMTISQDRAKKYNRDWDGVVQFGDWKQPKMEHARLMLTLLQSPLPIICCLRAKLKSHQVKGTKEMADAGIIEQRMIGKTCLIKADDESPIHDEGFISEMMVNIAIMQDHTTVMIKVSHPTLRSCFPKDRTEPISIHHGELLARWCNNAGWPTTATTVTQSAGTTAKKPAAELDTLKKELWDLTRLKHAGNKSYFRQYLVDELDLDPGKPVEDLTVEEIKRLLEKAKQKANQLL